MIQQNSRCFVVKKLFKLWRQTTLELVVYINQFEHIQRVGFMVSEVLGDDDEQLFITGMVILIDMSDFGMNHFTSMPLPVIKKLMPCFEVLHISF